MKRSKWPMLPALFALAAAAYYPAWRGGVLWDDTAHITHPALQSLQGLWRIWTELGATQQYYPLAHSAFWLQHQVWGEWMPGYHLVNIALHAASAFLTALIMRRLAIPGAWIAAGLFALHPLHVESVAWISELKNTLSTLFYLAAALLYLRYDDGRSRRYYFAALALFICALLTKTVTATLPAALLVIFWWLRGTLNIRRDVVPLLPFFLVGIAAGLLTAWVERHLIGAQGAAFDLSSMERILIAGRAVWFYFGKLLWPHPLIFIYPRWHVDAGIAWQYAFPIALVAVVAAFWMLRHRTRALLAVTLLFCGSLVPALGFVDVYPFRFSFVADHFAYLASIPVIAMVGAGVSRMKQKAERPVVVVGAVLLGALTWRQSRNYLSAETLYRETLTQNPTAWMAHNNLGELLAEEGMTAEARTHFVEAVRLDPTVAEHHMNLGRLLIIDDSLTEAITHLREALRLEPGRADASSNLGVALLRQDSMSAAMLQFEEALRVDPNHREARENMSALHLALGIERAEAGDIEQAIMHFSEAVAYRPTDPVIRYNYGTALLAAGRPREAIPHLEEAVRLSPDFAEANNNLEAARAAVQ